MKLVILIVLTGLLSSCGYYTTEGIRYESCTVTKTGNTSTILCPDGTTTTIADGTSYDPNEINDIRSDINDLKTRISELETNTMSNIEAINSLTTNINNLQITISNLEDSSEDYESDISELNAVASALETQLDLLQAENNANTTNIAILQGYNNIAELVDPCGNGPGYDEIFLRLSTGVIVASFSDNASGLNTRFSVLSPSDSLAYITTDGTSCNFKVPATGINANKVCWGAGYATCQ